MSQKLDLLTAIELMIFDTGRSTQKFFKWFCHV
jgi:hypothetical protein